MKKEEEEKTKVETKPETEEKDGPTKYEDLFTEVKEDKKEVTNV